MKDEYFNRLSAADQMLLNAHLDLNRALINLPEVDIFDELESVEYEAMIAVLRIKEVKTQLGAERSEN
jgi:hypothetical protein